MKAMKKSTPMKAMARVMKKKAVSKIARGKLAKAVVLRGGKEKTASGKMRSDLMKNKRGRVVSKAQYAAGKKSFKNISRWNESVVRARNELGIKGFCAINGAQESTSTWCARALCLHEVQTDQQPTCVGKTVADLGVVGSSFHMCGDHSFDAVLLENKTIQNQSDGSQSGCAVPGRRIWIGKQKDTKESAEAFPAGKVRNERSREEALPAGNATYGGASSTTPEQDVAAYGGACSMTPAEDVAAYGGACSMTPVDDAAAYGGVCSMSSSLLGGAAFGGSCRMTQMDGTTSSLASLDGLDYGGESNIAQLDGDSSYFTSRAAVEEPSEQQFGEKQVTGFEEADENMIKFLVVGTEIVWNEVKGMGAMHLFGKEWKSFMQKKLFVLDFVFQVFCQPCLEDRGDMGLQNGKMRVFLFEAMVKKISEEVQLRYFLMQQGLYEERTTREGQKEAALPDCAPGSTEDVSWDAGRVAEAAKEVGDAEVANGTLHWEENGMATNQSGHNADEVDGGHDYLAYEDVSWRSADEIPQAWEVCGGMDDEDWIINKRFKRNKEPSAQSFYPRLGERKTENIGSVYAEVANRQFRGGMNRFEALIEEEQVCEDEEGDHCSESEDWSDADDTEGLDSSTMTIESGRSYYAEFYQRKAEMRGGAGGANTTKNKQLTNALDALANVMKQLEPTQDEEDHAASVVGQIAKLAKQWQERTPTKGDMRKELQRLHQLLEKDVHLRVDPEASREAQGERRQSFYGDFVRKLKEGNEDGKENEWTTKGKGKGGKNGKAKGKGKKPDANMQRFDLQKIWPQKDISTSQILVRELESGKEPTGAVVAVENLDQMAQFQSLAKAHQLKKVVTLVAKAMDEEPTNITNADTVWLPYLSNLALVKAVVATTTGVKAEVKGMEPIKNKKSASMTDDAVTLRIVVDLWLIDEERARDYLRSHPHASLHHIMKKTQCQEIKTHGWTTGPDLLSGYCTLGAKDAAIVLSHSGKGGVFTSRLRQDVAQQPPVTWVRIEDKEGVMQYYQRVQQLAENAGVALARRSGGGNFLGYLQEDESDRNRAWQIFGVPHHWGPQTVRGWLQETGWKVEQTPKPPNNKYRSWAFQGRIDGQPKQTSYAYELDNNGKSTHITIQHWFKKRTPTEEEKANEKRLRGARWCADDTDPIEAFAETISPTVKFAPEVAETEMDVEATEGATKRSQDDQNKAASPEKKKTRKAGGGVKATPVLQGGCSGPEGSTLIDLGGGGDCGWRALAYMVATHNSPQNGDKVADRIETLARTMRAKVVSYLVQHQDQWKTSWVPDNLANQTTEAGPPATCFKEFVDDVLQREKRWVCGLCLAGAALLQHCTIIVWEYKGRLDQVHLKQHWHRAAVIRGKETTKPVVIPIVLHFGHYYAVRLPNLRKSWPREWCNTQSEEKEENINFTQDIENTKELTMLCRGGTIKVGRSEGLSVDAPGSTEDVSWDINLAGMLRGGAKSSDKKKKKAEEDDESLLRPFAEDDEAGGSEAGGAATAVPFSTPKRKRSRSCDIEEAMLRTFSTGKSKSTSKSINTLLQSCRTSKSTSAQKGKSWTCPVCRMHIDVVDSHKASKQVANHLRRMHFPVFHNALTENAKKNRWGAGMGLDGLVKAIPFQKMDKEDWATAEFVCPYCELALPNLGGAKTNKTDARYYLQRLSKKQHLRCECEFRHEKKHITLRQYYMDYHKMLGLYDENWYLNTVYAQKLRDKGHDPVVFRVDKKDEHTPNRYKHQVVCRKCRRCLSGDNTCAHRKKFCGGEADRKPWGPGHDFWEKIRVNKLNKEVKSKMGMSQQEINATKKIAERYSRNRGKKTHSS